MAHSKGCACVHRHHNLLLRFATPNVYEMLEIIIFKGQWDDASHDELGLQPTNAASRPHVCACATWPRGHALVQWCTWYACGDQYGMRWVGMRL